MFQRDKGGAPESFDTGLPPAQSGEDVPRWLIVLGLVAGLTLLVALLRYAIDLLGVVFVIILVGFAIRALSDWLTEGESVSGWAMSALSMGLMGTALVGLWLFNSRDIASDTLQHQLPGPVQRTVAWLETQGWGQRVLLSGGSSGAGLGGGGREGPAPAGTPPAAASDSGEPVTMARQPRVLPSLPERSVARPRTTAPRRGARDGDAEAASTPRPSSAPTPVPPVAAPVAAVATQVSLSASPVRPVVGQSVRLTASVRADGGRGQPGGVVVFFSDGAVIGRAAVRNGTAVLTTLGLAIGDHQLSAEYSGDDTHLPSRSATISQAVERK